MKGKQLIPFLALLITSCKVTEKNIVGFYKSDDVVQQTLHINLDHSFQYESVDIMRHRAEHANIDSCRFIDKGTWELKKNELIFTSYPNAYSDTDRVRSISKTRGKSKDSNFSFKDINGNIIPFDRIDDEKGNFALIVDKTYSDYDIDLSKHKTLTFYPEMYKPLIFVVKDSIPASYVITLTPFYRQGYFNNKKLIAKKKRLLNNKIKYKRENPVKDLTSPYIVHSPLHE